MARARTVGYTPTGRRRGWVAVVVGLLVIGGLVGGAFALGRATAPHTAAGGSTPGLVTRGGVPVPARHSVAGAATAVATYEVASFRVAAGQVDAGSAAAVLLAPQATDAAKQVLAAPTAPADQLTRTHSTYMPLSVVVQSYDSARAVVLVWGVAATSSQVTPQPAGTEDWGRATVTLLWDGGQWRVSDQRYAAGPWPVRSDQRLAVADGDFSFRANELATGWVYVPEP